MTTDAGFVDIDGLTGFIGMSRRTVYQMARDKQIPATKVRGQWRFDPQIIKDWLTRRMLDNCEQNEPKQKTEPQTCSEPIGESISQINPC